MSSRYSVAAFLLIVMWSGLLLGQQPATMSSPAVVPQLVNFSGKAVDAQGKTISGIAGVTFAIYREQYEGAPQWMETQNVTADSKGNYTAQLGAATASGLPLDLFSTGEARWLGVRINGAVELPRVLLLSVPYALKAADAQTLGGLPASAFMLAAPTVAVNNAGAAVSNSAVAGADDANPGATAPPPASSDVTTTGGAVNAVPLFTTTTNIQSSILTQTGTAAINVAGKLNLPATGAATASKGSISRPLDFVASSFNSGTAAPVTQTFQWQAEPVNNNTANPSAVLSLLYGSGTTAAAETGLRIGPKGILGFAPGQTFPGTGTITGVTAGTALTGGGTSGSVTLNVDTTKVPLLAAANAFTGNQTVNGNVGATGTVSASGFGIGGNLFAFGSGTNAFLGFAGNTTITGVANTGTGAGALASNTNGHNNTASGETALRSNTSGSQNTAMGTEALYNNTAGANNTASGYGSLVFNSTGSNNTAYGYGSSGPADFSAVTGSGNTFVGAYAAMSTGTLSNATAIGANAMVSEGNAMVLGSITGVNGATASTYVGIGTTTPFSQLDVYAENASNAINGVSSSGNAVTGTSSTGNAMVANGNVSQSRTGGGWVKAMVYVDYYNKPYTIVRCFNSLLTGSAATTPPCNFALTTGPLDTGMFVDFGFKVDDRFFMAENTYTRAFLTTCVDTDQDCFSFTVGPNADEVLVFSQDVNGNNIGSKFYLFLY